ncbi:substrate-binding periplasmic protein [Pseudomonas sp. NPDC089734]|uniref:substrate-binding periplasmic protein n=1 Tax=Pseudomonas sp. NPDC089734 TaxID=3364469 RepID=UPI0038217A5C
MHRRSIVISALLLLYCPFSGADEPPLRFSVAESWSMPLIRIENHQPTSGILFDIMQSLARHVGREAEFHVMPRLRVQPALERGEVDIRCYTAQAWVPTLSDNYSWSLPILYQRDLLVASAEAAANTLPPRFDHEIIGTVLGYNYTPVQHMFESRQWVREDARSQEHALRKLLAGRYDYAISSQLILDWINRDLPDNKQLKVISQISVQPAGCIVRNDPAIPVQEILRTLVRMKDSGEIREIVERYTAQLAR